MRLATWNHPAAEFLVSGFTSGAVPNPFIIERHAPEVCAARFVSGDVDIALLPSMLALQASEGIDVVAGAGLVSWKYPYARLVWKGGLSDFPRTVSYNRRVAQERFVARLIMHEHYGVDPEFVAYEDASKEDLIATGDDAALITGVDVPTFQTDAFSIDIGREWYELVNYPMVWGLFVTKRGAATKPVIEALIASAKAAEENRDLWVQSQEMPAVLHEFFQDDLRTGLDRLAIASLTALRKYLFYYDVTEEIVDIPFAYVDDEDEDDTSPPASGRAPEEQGEG